ncbi:MAG: hypothetical protein AAFV07_12085 [Bacteroidota bacterium]
MELICRDRKSFHDRCLQYPDIVANNGEAIERALHTSGWIGAANFILAESYRLFTEELSGVEKRLKEVQSN